MFSHDEHILRISAAVLLTRMGMGWTDRAASLGAAVVVDAHWLIFSDFNTDVLTGVLCALEDLAVQMLPIRPQVRSYTAAVQARSRDIISCCDGATFWSK